jgi:hypothetical protein
MATRQAWAEWAAALAAAVLLGAPGYSSEPVASAPPDTASSDPAAAEKPTYMVIPIRGMIGKDFSSQLMKIHLERAEKLKPTVVVLEVDTGGGDIVEAERIVDLLIAAKGTRFVAFVRKALSAGATITLACKEIFVTEGATIGAATSYQVGEDGMPGVLAEKFQSAWRAVCRKAAECGRHPAVLADAMVDPDFALTMRIEREMVVLERDGHGSVLKARGRILTLTARESVSCGLAKGIVADIPELGERLSMRAWQLARPESYTYLRKQVSREWFANAYNRFASRFVVIDDKCYDMEDPKNRDAYVKRTVGHVVYTADNCEVAQIVSDTEILARIPGRPGETQAEFDRRNEPFRLIPGFMRLTPRPPVQEILFYVKGVPTKALAEGASFAGRKLVYAGAERIKGKNDSVLTIDIYFFPSPLTQPTEEQFADVLASGLALVNHEQEKEAINRMNLALAFKKNGLKDKALSVLRSILEDCPDTLTAGWARAEIQVIEKDDAGSRDASRSGVDDPGKKE